LVKKTQVLMTPPSELLACWNKRDRRKKPSANEQLEIPQLD